MVNRRQHNVQVMIGAESTYGTEATRDTAVGRVNTVNINEKNGFYKSRGLGAGRKALNSNWGPYRCEWSLDYGLHALDILEYVIGDKSGAGSSGDPYVLTEATVVSTADLRFFSMEVISNESSDLGETYCGCVARSWSISGAVGNNTPIRINISGVAQKPSPETSATSYTEPTTDEFSMHQASFAWGASPTTIGKVSSFRVGGDNGLIIDGEADSRFIIQPDVGELGYTFTLTIIMSDTEYTALRTSAHGGASGPVDGKLGAAPATDEMKITISEGVATGNRTLLVWLDECYIDEIVRAIQLGNGFVKVTFNGHANTGKDNKPLRWYAS